MKRWALVAALVLTAAALAQPGWAASKKAAACPSQQAVEAEQAIRFLTDVMVASSACQNTTYAEFRLRNKDAIIAYQKVMIAHMHGAAAFDHWNTALANAAAQKEGAIPTGQFCQQSEPLMKQAGTLDTAGFRAYAAQQAAAAPQTASCGH